MARVFRRHAGVLASYSWPSEHSQIAQLSGPALWILKPATQGGGEILCCCYRIVHDTQELSQQ